MKRTKAILLTACLVSVQVATGQSAITLEACVQWARDNSPQTRQLGLLDADLRIGNRVLSRSWWPQSAINGKATWQSEVISLPLDIPGLDIQSPPQDQYQISLDIRQNIWDGGLTNAQRQQNTASNQIEKKQVETNLYQLDRQVAQLYFGALLADRLRSNSELVAQNIRQRIEQVKAAVANGTAIRSNISQLEVRLLETEQRTLEATEQRQAALAALGVLTGRDLPPSVEMIPAQLIRSEENTIDRPELDLIAARQESLLATKALINAREAPKLNAFVQAGYGQPGLNFLDQGFNSFMVIGGQFSIPLSHLYTRKSRLEQDQLSIRNHLLSRQRDQFVLQTRVLQTNEEKEISRLRGLIETDRQIIALREGIRQVASGQLENGIITSRDYLEELNEEDLARQQLILHEVQLSQAIFNRNFLLGKHSE